jgi:hypothetical protein
MEFCHTSGDVEPAVRSVQTCHIGRPILFAISHLSISMFPVIIATIKSRIRDFAEQICCGKAKCYRGLTICAALSQCGFRVVEKRWSIDTLGTDFGTCHRYANMQVRFGVVPLFTQASALHKRICR